MIRTEPGHFYITFPNGYTVSVFNGFGSYSDNHFRKEILGRERVESTDCEVAIIHNNNLLRIEEWGAEKGKLYYVLKILSVEEIKNENKDN